MSAKQRFCLRVLSLLAICAAAATDCAAELQTYRIESNQPRLLRYGGSLSGLGFSAQISGSFDVEVENDGTATLTRFDVNLTDLLDQSLAPFSWIGLSLADRLYVDPVGLTGTQDSTLTRISSHPIPTSPGDFHLEKITTLRLTPDVGELSRLHIFSDWSGWTDVPSFRTSDPGFLVRLVPEPSVAALVLFGAISLVVPLRFRRL